MKKKQEDAKEDAELGEEVENLVEQHMAENKEAEAKEGHKMSVKKKLDDKIKAMKKASAHLQEVPKEPFTEDQNLLEAMKRDPKERIKEKIGVLKEMAAFLKSTIAKDDPPPTIEGGTTINTAIGSPFGKSKKKKKKC